jgi:RHS repeat-associated protein
MGKVDENKGDSLAGFDADLDEETILTHIQYPLANPHDILQKATTRLVYDLYAYYRTRDDPQPQPAVVYTLARETHDADLDLGQLTKIQHSFSYSDGFGREIQKKIQAEPGDMDDVHTDPRWVGSGWTIFNNKGKPVRVYEPFFSTTHQFEFAKTVGVSSTLFYDPLGRVVATLHPNHTYEKVVFDPWRQETWDVNDMLNPTQVFDPRSPDVLPDHTFNPADDPDVGEHFRRSPQSEYLPTWYDVRMDTSKAILKWPDVDPATGAPIPKNAVIRAAEKSAAEKAAKHAATPDQAYLDTLGRTFLTVADNGLAQYGTRQEYKTLIEQDIEGNQRAVIDARGCMVMQYEYNMLGNHIKQDSLDAGERWVFNNVAGNPIRAWNSNNYSFRHVYDALQRPTHLFVREGDDDEILSGRTIYGETHPDSQPSDPDTPPPCILNLRGQIYQHYDGAGVVTSVEFDFKGNQLRSSRRLSRTYRETMDWSTLAGLTRIEEIETAASSLLEDETFVSSSLYDALNRPITLITPHTESIPLNEIRPAYNEAGLLDKVDARLRDADEWTEFVTNINYDAKGQREMILYGNGVRTGYEYDPDTFRLNYLNTTRSTNDRPLQDLRYTYDPVGNITEIYDDAHRTIFYDNGIIKPSLRYEYDALYRLIQANGREHESMSGCHYKQDSKKQTEFIRLTQPINNAHALLNYIENYTYDQSGNLTQIKHNGRWTRNQIYSDTSNRLETSHVSCEGALPFHYPHDPNGNITAMPHLPELAWDYADRLERVDLDLNGNKAYYTYDASGQRVRKVVEKGSIREERIYLGGFEIYRKYQNGRLKFERQTLHVMDDQKRIALVETRTIDTDDTEAGQPENRIRIQLDNHLGSSVLEVDDTAQAHIISYEEYYPYGGTAYIAGKSETEVKRKRYRYTGKERDDETGLYYYGARYYAPWLGRWMSCDPAGLADGNNMWLFSKNNPIQYIDKNGKDSIHFFRNQSGEWQYHQISSEGTNQYFYTTSMIEGDPASDPSVLASIQRSSVEIPFPEFSHTHGDQTDIRRAQRLAESWYTDTPERLHGEPENISAMARLVLSETGRGANTLDRLAVAEVIRNRAIMSGPGRQFSPHTYSQIVFSGAFPPAHGVAGQTINPHAANAFLRPLHTSTEQLIDSIQASLTAHFNESNVAQSAVWYPRDASGEGGTEVAIPGTDLEAHRFFRFVMPGGGQEWEFRPGAYTHSDAIGNRREGLWIEEVIHRQEERRIERRTDHWIRNNYSPQFILAQPLNLQLSPQTIQQPQRNLHIGTDLQQPYSLPQRETGITILRW